MYPQNDFPSPPARPSTATLSRVTSAGSRVSRRLFWKRTATKSPPHTEQQPLPSEQPQSDVPGYVGVDKQAGHTSQPLTENPSSLNKLTRESPPVVVGVGSASETIPEQKSKTEQQGAQSEARPGVPVHTNGGAHRQSSNGGSPDVPPHREVRQINNEGKTTNEEESIEEPAMVNIEDLKEDDVVIAVMGPTGSGKSTFISSASGHDTKGIGHSLKSCTSEVLAIKFFDEESERRIVLVDTPGFDDTYKSDLDILHMISDWLNASYDQNKLLSGILYLHRITDNRMAGTPLKNLRVFQKLCGKDALEKVYFTTTMWDEVDEEIGKRRLEELSKEYWKSMIDHGAHIARCRGDTDDPKKLVKDILFHDEQRRALRLQEEMGIQKKELKETAAGQQLFSQLEKLVERQSELLQKIIKERKEVSNPASLAELQQEYKELREQIDDKLRQMQELKLSRFQNIRRFLFRR